MCDAPRLTLRACMIPCAPRWCCRHVQLPLPFEPAPIMPRASFQHVDCGLPNPRSGT